jgi:hypothetical protein
MRPLPTDLAILNAIYERHYDRFVQFSRESPDRAAKIYVPIDIAPIAEELKVDRDIVFGRLYYHLQRKHGYTQDDGAKVPFFTLQTGDDMHLVNFPLLASVLADLRDQRRIYNRATLIAVGSLFVSVVAITITILSQR